MNILKDFAHGIFMVLKTIGAPQLYRYPYRNSAEALRGDWLKVSGDIQLVMEQIKSEKPNG